jgi:superfamily II DNA or RNA helicase
MIAVPKKSFSPAQWVETQKKLTCKIEEFQSKETHDLHFYVEAEDDMVFVPKFFPLPFVVPAQTNEVHEHSTCSFTCQLRPDQTEAMDKIVNALRATTGAILIAPAGSGKTNVAIAAGCKLGGRMLVLCLQEDWLTQWFDRFKNVIRGDIKVGWIQQDRCEYENCDIVLASVKSIAARDYPEDALNCDLLIVDEVHHTACATYLLALCKITCKYTLGLTATPKRRAFLDQMVRFLIGEPIHGMQRPPNPQVQVNMILYSLGAQKEVHKQNTLNWSYMITLLTRDAVRNRLLVALVQLLLKAQPGRKGLLLSARVDHLKQLHHALGPEISAIITGEIHTDMTKKDRAAKKRKREQIRFEKFLTLSTYLLLGESTDFDGDFVILGTPVPHAEQPTGRIMRGRNRQHRPAIFDIVDPFSIFQNWTRQRISHYTANGYQILQLKERQIFQQRINT